MCSFFTCLWKLLSSVPGQKLLYISSNSVPVQTHMQKSQYKGCVSKVLVEHKPVQVKSYLKVTGEAG